LAFATDVRLTTQDHDDSADVYLWSPTSLQFQLASFGGGEDVLASTHAVSSGGRFVTYLSNPPIDTCATELPTDTCGRVYVSEVANGETTMASVTSSGIGANGGSSYPAITADGRYVVFSSNATNLVPRPQSRGSQDQVFLHDLWTRSNYLVSAI